MKKRVALIFGGEGREHSISERSAENLCELINKSIYDILPIGISENGDWFIYGGPFDRIGTGEWSKDPLLLKRTHPVKSGFWSADGMIRVHAAILCLHGDFGEDGSIGGALAVAHIPYVGQDVYSSAVTQDKAYTKCIAEHLGIPTAKWMLSTSEDAAIAKRRAEDIIGYPMFIKPPRLGSSYGAHPIRTPEEFEAAFADARAYDGRVLIERLIEVEYEAECAMLSMGGSRRFSVGIINSHGAFYDFQTKYSESERTVALPFCRDEEVVNRICTAADMLSEYIGLRHLSRIDFFVTKDKEILFNEINTFPGMTRTSLYPALTEKMGLARGEFLSLLIESVCKDDGHI